MGFFIEYTTESLVSEDIFMIRKMDHGRSVLCHLIQKLFQHGRGKLEDRTQNEV